ncbi:hypothetical protein JRO89_XS06G0041900 [Xanthoceras sorbifolium]|uniref:Uncharacterized protein n=1 Tax=Xanthoceras sorbifolium TaxID=99658 RepID=A0ABQ8HWK4_9ROSI|nr:hypothetical protein JRO89_XS06G0041900 [Xanthoceras sorbifolium]
MDGSQIIDILDSLWFFSNVISSSSKGQEKLGHVTDPELLDQEEEEEAAAKPMNQAEENQKQNDESPGAENLVKMCPKCGEFAAEIESLKVVVEHVGQAVEELAFAHKTEEKKKASSSTSSRTRRRRRSKKRSLFHEKRQIFREADLGFYGQMESESPWLLYHDDQETTFDQYEKFGSHNVNMKMKMPLPPLNDGMAMKQHLKSWAHAVACTVR